MSVSAEACLAFVSPRIVSALLDGTAPADLTVTTLARGLPYSWADQERRLHPQSNGKPAPTLRSSVLVVVLRPDHIAGQDFSSGQRGIPLIASLRVLRASGRAALEVHRFERAANDAAGLCWRLLNDPPTFRDIDLKRDANQERRAEMKTKVLFQPFIGISSRRYRDIFEKKSRKDRNGSIRDWYEGGPAPRLEDRSSAYIENEEPLAYFALGELYRPAPVTTSKRPPKNK